MVTLLLPLVGARTAICSPWVSACGLPSMVSVNAGVPTIALRNSGTAWVQVRLPSTMSPPGCTPAAFICATT